MYKSPNPSRCLVSSPKQNRQDFKPHSYIPSSLPLPHLSKHVKAYSWTFERHHLSFAFSTRIKVHQQSQGFQMGCNIFSRKHVAGIPWGEAPARKVSTAPSGRTSVSTRGRQSLSVPQDTRSRSRSVHGDIIGSRGQTIGGGH